MEENQGNESVTISLAKELIFFPVHFITASGLFLSIYIQSCSFWVKQHFSSLTLNCIKANCIYFCKFSNVNKIMRLILPAIKIREILSFLTFWGCYLFTLIWSCKVLISSWLQVQLSDFGVCDASVPKPLAVLQ